MQVYTETLDPSETKDWAYDWSDFLGSGETITAVTASLVQAGGASQSSAASNSDLVTRVWLTGGTHGQRVIFTVAITTNGGRTLEESFGVDVIDTSIGPAAETDVERITRELAAARALRITIASGNAVTELWRDGRRITKKMPSLRELTEHIRVLESELVSASATAAGTARRRPISLAWRN
jgi:hypothetical protein